MKSEDVAEYLKTHPEFFAENGPLLADISLPHPHGDRAISIGERQLLALREKIRLLESRLVELIQFGEENDAIGDRVHRVSLALLTARNLDALLHAIYFNLREDFAVPHVLLRLWGGTPANPDTAEFSPVSNELRGFTENLAHPYCGPHAVYETGSLFGEDSERLASFAMVALRAEQTFGLLVLASEDPERFYPEMGTLYLKRLGELVSVALMRHLNEG